MEYSVLYRQRAALWKELGEDDPTKYTYEQYKGEGDKRKPAKTNTESQKLGACLMIAQPWTEARWARVIMVPDPRVDSVRTKDDNTYRNTIPVVVDFYENEAKAKAAFEKFRRRGQEGDGAEASGKPTLPDVWVGDDLGETAFIDALKGVWGGPPAVVAKQMGCTADQAQAWGEYLGLQ